QGRNRGGRAARDHGPDDADGEFRAARDLPDQHVSGARNAWLSGDKAALFRATVIETSLNRHKARGRAFEENLCPDLPPPRTARGRSTLPEGRVGRELGKPG